MGCRCATNFPDLSQLRKVRVDTPNISAASLIEKYISFIGSSYINLNNLSYIMIQTFDDFSKVYVGIRMFGFRILIFDVSKNLN